jgi:hypothetical protein
VDDQASGPPPQYSKEGDWYWDGKAWVRRSELESEPEAPSEEDVPQVDLPVWPPPADLPSGWDGPRLVLRQGYGALLPFVTSMLPIVLLVVVLSFISRQYVLYAVLMLVVLVPVNLALSGWWRAVRRPHGVLGLDPVGVRATDGAGYDLEIPWRAVRAVRIARYLGLTPRIEIDVDMQQWRPALASTRSLIVAQRDLGNRMRAGRLTFFPDVSDQARLEEWVRKATPEGLYGL